MKVTGKHYIRPIEERDPLGLRQWACTCGALKVSDAGEQHIFDNVMAHAVGVLLIEAGIDFKREPYVVDPDEPGLGALMLAMGKQFAAEKEKVKE